MDKKTVLITGASGLLGREILRRFKEFKCWEKVVGTAFSRYLRSIKHSSIIFLNVFFKNRSGENLVKVDLTDPDEIDRVVSHVKPDVLIHSAAQRFPDKMQNNPEQARKLNIEATKDLASVVSEFVLVPCFLVAQPCNHTIRKS